MQILVLGSHRSGTSMVTRLIHMMGAYFGTPENSLGANEENPKGFWERKDVVEWNKSLLRRLGGEWDNIASLAIAEPYTLNADERQSLQTILHELDGHRPWVVKDPRLCLTLPYWKPLLQSPVAVMVHRDPLEVAISLQTRNQIPLLCGVALWEHYTAAAWNASAGMKWIIVDHRELMKDPVAVIQRIWRELGEAGAQGLVMPAEKDILDFVEPNLYRSKQYEAENEHVLNYQQKTLLDIVTGKTQLGGKKVEISVGGKIAMRDYAERVALWEERKALQTNIETLGHTIHHLHTHIDGLTTHIDGLTTQKDDLIAQLAESENRCEAMQRHRDALHASSSWKIGSALVRAGRLVLGKK